MVNPQVKMVSSHISHMALHSVWRDSGVTQKHGFELIVDVCFVPRADGTVLGFPDRATCVFGNLKHALEIGGVNLDAVEFVSLESQDPTTSHTVVDAVARGEASAGNVAIPFDVIGHKRGLHTLGIPSLPVIHNATICANREWVQRNEETAVAFLKSMVDAIHFFKREKSRVCEILERELAPIVRI